MLSRERKAELVEAYRDTARRLRDFWAQDSGTSIHLVAADNLDDAAGFIEAMPEDGCGEAEGWRTIASAPKDGTQFVMLDANVQTPALGHWEGNVEWRNAGKKIGEALVKPCWFPLATPTHWMPLPAPPVAASPTGVGEESTAG